MHPTSQMGRASLVACMPLLFLLIPLGRAIPKTWHVDPAGAADGRTIQAAIDGAEEGDSIFVAPGTYKGDGNRDLSFHGKAISLVGTAGPEETTIDCEGKEDDPHRGFHLHEAEGEGTYIAGFTVTNGYVEGHFPASYGGAILCVGSSPTIEDCWLIKNRSDHFGGGMVCFESASPKLTRVRFIENTAKNNGGGFGSKMKCNPTLTDVLFVRNSAKRGGGFWCWKAGAYLNQATFVGNSGTVSAGGIWSNNADMRIRNTIVAFSSAGEAIACTNPPPEVKVKNCNFYGNAGGDEIPFCIIEQGGNFSLDPEFVDQAKDDFSLKKSSPCAPGNHPEEIDVGWIGVRQLQTTGK